MKGLKTYIAVGAMVLGVGGAVAQNQLTVAPPEYYFNEITLTCWELPTTSGCSPTGTNFCLYYDVAWGSNFVVYDSIDSVTLKCKQPLYRNP